MNIEVCGPGRSKCAQLGSRAREAVERAGDAAVIENAGDMSDILARGILQTPALVVDGTVVAREDPRPGTDCRPAEGSCAHGLSGNATRVVAMPHCRERGER